MKIMDVIEMNRLQKGQHLLSKIDKLKAQIQSLNGVTFINLGTLNKKKYSPTQYNPKTDEMERVVNMDIPLNILDKTPHPFADKAAIFVSELSQILQQQLKDLQEEFKSL